MGGYNPGGATAGTGLTTSQVQDIVGTMATGGIINDMAVAYDNVGKKLNFNANQAPLTNYIQDTAGGMVGSQSNIAVSYDAALKKIAYNVSASAGSYQQQAAEIWVDDQVGATWTDRFKACYNTVLTAVQNGNLIPVIRAKENTSVGQTNGVPHLDCRATGPNGGPFTLFAGLRFYYGDNPQQEYTGTASDTARIIVDCDASSSAFVCPTTLITGTGTNMRSTQWINILFQSGANASTATVFQNNGTFWWSIFSSVSFNGFLHGMNGPIDGLFWYGACHVQACFSSGFNINGSDSFLWIDGLFFDSHNVTATDYHLDCALDTSVVGPIYFTGHLATCVRVRSGHNTMFYGVKAESQNNNNTQMAGAAIRVEGGTTTWLGLWLFGAMNNPAATGRNDGGTFHVNAGQANLIGPCFADNSSNTSGAVVPNGSLNYPHVYANSGARAFVSQPTTLYYDLSSNGILGPGTNATNIAARYFATGGAGNVYIDGYMRLGTSLADQTLAANSTALVNLTGFAAWGFAGETYEIECTIFYDAATLADLKLALAYPGGATNLSSAYLWVCGLATAATGGQSSANFAVASGTAPIIVGGIDATTCALFLKAIVTIGDTAGTINLQGAQGTSNATAVVIHGKSYGTLRRIA